MLCKCSSRAKQNSFSSTVFASFNSFIAVPCKLITDAVCEDDEPEEEEEEVDDDAVAVT